MIEFKDVSFSYQKSIIFRDLNFKIAKGEFIHLEGANGSGKTTLLRLILDLIRPQSGTLTRNEEFLCGWAPAVDNSFFPRLNGRENLQFFSDLAGKKLITPDYFDHKLTEDILKAPFYQMSSGMKQILIILRSLLDNPHFLLLDEPMRGLDQQHKVYFFDLLKRLKKENKTVLLTSHLPLESDLNFFTKRSIHDFQIH